MDRWRRRGGAVPGNPEDFPAFILVDNKGHDFLRQIIHCPVILIPGLHLDILDFAA